MSNDVYTEITEQSFGSRVKNSLSGIIVGIIFVIAAAIFLFWNEGRTIKRLRTLEQGQNQLVQLQANQPVNPENNGKLVYIAGVAMTMESQHDNLFGITSKGISLSRKVQMYQWGEHKETRTETSSGGTERTITTYSYDKGWFSSQRDSSRYKQAAGHMNPHMPFKSHTFLAKDVKVGELKLTQNLISKIDNYNSFPLGEVAIPEKYIGKATVENDTIYIGNTAQEPSIGDIKVTYTSVASGMVSIIAKQNHDMLEAYYMDEGVINILKTGNHTAQDLFKSEKKSNSFMGWGLRLIGWFVIFIGFALIFSPLSVLASFIPVLGSIIGASTSFISFILASVLSLIMIAIGWVSFRPMIGYTLLGIAGALIILFIFKKGKHPQGQ